MLWGVSLDAEVWVGQYVMTSLTHKYEFVTGIVMSLLPFLLVRSDCYLLTLYWEQSRFLIACSVCSRLVPMLSLVLAGQGSHFWHRDQVHDHLFNVLRQLPCQHMFQDVVEGRGDVIWSHFGLPSGWHNMVSLQPELKCKSCLMYGWLLSVVKVLEGTGIQSYLLSAHSLLTYRITYPLFKGVLTGCSESYLLRVQRITYPACKGLLELLTRDTYYLLRGLLTACSNCCLLFAQRVTYCYLTRVTYYSFKGLLTWVSYIQAKPALKTYTYAAIPVLS